MTARLMVTRVTGICIKQRYYFISIVMIPRRGSCKHGVDILQSLRSRQLWRIE